MYIEATDKLRGRKRASWSALLSKCGLEESNTDHTVLVWEGDELIAAGSREGNILKCIAVDDAHQGEDLTATVLTHLRQSAFESGYNHLFLYTKPRNEHLFAPLLFHSVAKTSKVALMEDRSGGIRQFLSTFPVPATQCGCIVMNADPFTLGHRYLVETAAKQCGQLLVFVLSEDRGLVPAADRLELVKRGTADLPNVTVLPTGPYLISSATFPTYFLKERDNATDVQCMLDVEVFTKYFVPHFRITRRFVGTEPLSALTSRYNEILKVYLPPRGVELIELPRLEQNDIPISAGAVRKALEKGDRDTVRALVPQSTFNYLFKEATI